MSTLDRNKSALTHAITKRVALWMDERGFKPVETEVWLGDRWIADLVGVITPTQTELIDLKLIRRAPSYRYTEPLVCQQWEATRDAIPGILTCAVEVKVSRSDFTGDWKWQAPAQTDLRYIAFPRGLMPDYEWPVGWGIIEMSTDGSKVLKVHKPTITPQSSDQRLKVTLSLAVRQFNTVRYARQREWQKEVRVEDGARRTVGRVQDAINVVLDVANGRRTVDEALAGRNIRSKLSDWTRRELEALHGRLAGAEVAA